LDNEVIERIIVLPTGTITVKADSKEELREKITDVLRAWRER